MVLICRRPMVATLLEKMIKTATAKAADGYCLHHLNSMSIPVQMYPLMPSQINKRLLKLMFELQLYWFGVLSVNIFGVFLKLRD